MRRLFKHFSLSRRLTALIVFAIFFSFLILGFNFDSFLKKNDLKHTQERMIHAFDRIVEHINKKKISLSKGIAFSQSNESLLASIDLINNYQNKDNYNTVLLDEEKKIIAQTLLNKVKFSLNDEIVLYDKNGELIAYVIKMEKQYQLNFISYENGKRRLFSKYEDEEEYRLLPYKSHRLIEFKHLAYYKMADATNKTLITYRLDGIDILIESHHNIISENGSITAHIEMAYKLNKAYFQHLSDDLNMVITLKRNKDITHSPQSILEANVDKTLPMKEENDSYVSSMYLNTIDGKIDIILTLQKSILQHSLRENRYQLFLLILAVTMITLLLLRFLFYRGLIVPLDLLMQQISRVQHRDYSPAEILHTGDELEEISLNVNHLAGTIKRREEELKKSQETLTYLSYHDVLTTLPNRRFFEEKLQDTIKSSHKDRSNFALLFLDLDKFKEVNDTLGHPAGDVLLQQVSQALKSVITPKDTLARFGGDEFMILVRNISEDNRLEGLIHNIMECFKVTFHCMEYEIKSSVSIGIAKFLDYETDEITLISNADLALYQAKLNGGHNYCYFTLEMMQDFHQRINMIKSIKEALKRSDQFFLLYQPKISTATGEVIAIEALIRWNSPEGLMRPDEFIPLAEETALIIPLGKWVLEQACRDFVPLQKEHYLLEQISINVSTVQMLQSDMLQTMKDVIEDTHIEAKYIELEITESYVATEDNAALKLLQKLRDMNIELAIDDFGTGYSSLSYLQKLPVTRLKIDKSFIDDLPHSRKSQAIVTAIMTLCKSFDLSSTAEGVTNKEQFDFLQELGCDEIQGYYCAEPLTLDELREFLAQERVLTKDTK